MILVDTNVIVDVVTRDPIWFQRSSYALRQATASDQLAINDVVFAELSIMYDRLEELEWMLETAEIDLVPTPRTALFLAGRAYQKYRRQSGTKTGVLPDFFVGAHAAVEAVPLLTRDTRRIKTYFPSVNLIIPK